MPAVTVNLYAAARAAVGSSELIVEAGTLESILAAICDAYPGFAGVWPRCSFLIDGLAAHGDPATIEIPGGSALDVLPPFAGG